MRERTHVALTRQRSICTNAELTNKMSAIGALPASSYGKRRWIRGWGLGALAEGCIV
jgi:hypothetical protein